MSRRTIFLRDRRAMRDCSTYTAGDLSQQGVGAGFDCFDPERLLDQYLSQGSACVAAGAPPETLESTLLPLCSYAASEDILGLVRNNRLGSLIENLSCTLQVYTSASSIIRHAFFLLGRLANAGAEMPETAIRAGLPYLSGIANIVSDNQDLAHDILWFYAHAANYDVYGRQQLLLYASVDELLSPISALLQLDTQRDDDPVTWNISGHCSLLDIVPLAILRPIGFFLSNFLANCHVELDAEAFVYARKVVLYFFAAIPLFSQSKEWRHIGNNLLFGLNKFYDHRDFAHYFDHLYAWRPCIRLLGEYQDMAPELLCFIGNLAATSIENNIFADIATSDFTDILACVLEGGVHSAYTDVAIIIETLFSQWHPYRTVFRKHRIIKTLVSNFYSVTHVTVNSSINIVSLTVAEAWQELVAAGLIEAIAHYLQNAVIKKTVSYTIKFTGKCFQILYQILELSRNSQLEETVTYALTTDILYGCYTSAFEFPSMTIYASVSALLELTEGIRKQQKGDMDA